MPSKKPKGKPPPRTSPSGGEYVILGLDPGESGAVARMLCGRYGVVSVESHPMPDTDGDKVNLLRELVPMLGGLPFMAYLELVTGYIPAAGKQPGSRMFNFGVSYGVLRMALCALRIPYETVQPHQWQKKLSIPKMDRDRETKDEFKRRLKEKARQLYPQQNWTLKTCDAVLIAEYGRRKFDANAAVQEEGGRK